MQTHAYLRSQDCTRLRSMPCAPSEVRRQGLSTYRHGAGRTVQPRRNPSATGLARRPPLSRYTCPPRGPLAQLGERRPCTAEVRSVSPQDARDEATQESGGLLPPQQPPRPRVGVSSFCRIGLPVLREPRSGRSMTCVRPLAHERYDRLVRSREEAAHEGWRRSLRLIRISRGESCEEAELRSSRLRR